MKAFFGIALAACCAALAVEPSATLFDNDQVRVARALERVHVKGGFHEHKPNRVMVYLQSGKQRFEYQDGRAPAVFDWKPGQIVWSKSDGMHSPEVIGDEPFNIIEVELKKPGAGGSQVPISDALAKDHKHYSVEVENDQVRVIRVKLDANSSTKSMAHPLNSVVVYLTASGVHHAGEAVWVPAGTYKEENTSATPAEMVVVEIKS